MKQIDDAQRELAVPVRTTPSSALRALVVLLICATCWGGCKREDGASQPSKSAASQAAGDGRVLVFAHSFTGRTAVAGREIARMLRGHFEGFSDPPKAFSEAVAEAVRNLPVERTLAELLPSVNLDGVETVFVGFPIWHGQPAPPVFELVNALPLGGKRVVPFFTHLHHAAPEGIARLREAVEARGATWNEPLVLRMPMATTYSEILRRTRRALLARPDIWRTSGPETRAQCDPGPGDGSAALCRIPAGQAWVDVPGLRDGAFDDQYPVLVPVKAFAIGQTEVSVADYAKCVEAGACPPARHTTACTEILGARTDVPVPCVSSIQAKAYCASVGMRLPTLAEWTRAARGDTPDPYPWGATFAFSGRLGNFGETPATAITGYATASPDGGFQSDGYAGLAEGCHFPEGTSRFGVCDLSGNLAELVSPGTLVATDRVVLVGGSWADGEPSSFRVDSGVLIDARLGYEATGFRCAMDL